MNTFVNTLVGGFFNSATLFIPLLQVSILLGVSVLFALGVKLLRYTLEDMKLRKLGGDKLEVWKNGKRIY